MKKLQGKRKKAEKSAPVPSESRQTGSFFVKIWHFLLVQRLKLKAIIREKKEERLTIMFIPHNERSIRNYHISNLTLTIILASLSLIIVVSSLLIINHTSTVQEVGILKVSQKDAKIQFARIREEIKTIAQTYDSVRENLSSLYGLIHGNSGDNLFAQGGAKTEVDQLEDEQKEELKSAESIPREIFLLNRILGDMSISELPLKEVEDFIRKREKIIRDSPTLWPVEGYIINPFGFVRNAVGMQVKFNNGIDIAATPGAKVLVTARGWVTEIARDSDWGWIVKVRHNYGYVSVYRGLGHLNDISVNDKLGKGDVIGYMGQSADSMESILHYEIQIGVEPQNPVPYLGFLPGT